MKRKITFFILLIVPVLLVGAFWPARTAESAPLDQGITGAGAAWYHADWHYRRPVTVTNTSTTLTNYQVLVRLDNGNFNFTHANNDGSDLRVTNSDGITPLPFWIESWTSSLAYVWIKVPSIPASGNAAVYLYFGNTAAASTSDGTQTFDLFEDTWHLCANGIGTCNPVHQATQPWWESSVSYPMVFEDTSLTGRPRYHMLYDGHNVIGHAKGYAWSSDLYNWTEYDAGTPHPPNANPIMAFPVGYPGAGYQYAWGDTIKVGSTYYMFVSQGPGTTQRVESTDLVNWSNFTTLTTNDSSGIGSGAAILKEGDGITPIPVGSRYWMVYFHGSNPGTMYLASSTDLLNWTYTGSAFLTPTSGGWDQGGLWTPSFARIDNNYFIYYQGDALIIGDQWETGYATAAAYSGETPLTPDSTTWAKSATPAIQRGGSGSWDSTYVIDPMIRKFSNGIYYVFYTGDVANGYATATSPEGPWTKIPTTLSWTTLPLNSSVTSSGGILSLASGRGEQSNATFRYRALGYRANFGPGNGTSAINMWGGFIIGYQNDRTMIGTNRSAVDVNLYLRNYVSAEQNGLLGAYQNAYHVYEILWRNGMSTGKVDHGLAVYNQPLDVPTVTLPVTFYNYNNGTNPLRVDWAYIRQYNDPEPTTSVRGYSDIQETQAITGTGTPDFSLVGITVTVTTTGNLTSLQVIRYEHDHPNGTYVPAAGGAHGTKTARYWEINPNNTGYTVNLTLPHNRVPDEEDKVCRWTGTGVIWDCVASGYDAGRGIIWRNGITQLSDWATGNDVGPTAVQLIGLTATSTRGKFLQATVAASLVTSLVAAIFLWRRRAHAQH